MQLIDDRHILFKQIIHQQAVQLCSPAVDGHDNELEHNQA